MTDEEITKARVEAEILRQRAVTDAIRREELGTDAFAEALDDAIAHLHRIATSLEKIATALEAPRAPNR